MGMINFLPEGTWWVRSASDPRWSASGRANVGMFSQPEESKEAIERLKEQFGEAPDDLEWGYMKD